MIVAAVDTTRIMDYASLWITIQMWMMNEFSQVEFRCLEGHSVFVSRESLVSFVNQRW